MNILFIFSRLNRVLTFVNRSGSRVKALGILEKAFRENLVYVSLDSHSAMFPGVSRCDEMSQAETDDHELLRKFQL